MSCWHCSDYTPRCRNTPDLEALWGSRRSGEKFSNRTKRAQTFKRATEGGADAAKWLSRVSQFSDHAVLVAESAPVLYWIFKGTHDEEEFADAAERAISAKALLKRYGWPAQLLKIKVSFNAVSWRRSAGHDMSPMRKFFAGFEPKVLGNEIPKTKTAQKKWIKVIERFITRMEEMPFGALYVLQSWERMIEASQGDLGHFADFAIARRDRFDVRWGAARLKKEIAIWEHCFALEQLEKDSKHFPLPEGFSARTWSNDFELIALNSINSLRAEGAVMRHCVGGYGAYVEEGSSVIYAVRGKGERGTLQISRRHSDTWQMTQLKGPRNCAVSSEMADACKAMLKKAIE